MMVPASSLVDTMKWREIKNKKCIIAMVARESEATADPISPKAPESLEPTA